MCKDFRIGKTHYTNKNLMENKTQVKTNCAPQEKRGAITHLIVTFLLALTMLIVTYVWPNAEFINSFVWGVAVMYSISGMEVSKRIGRFYE